MLTLTILGCDGSHASAGGAASGYLVREWDSGTTIWLDAGPGTFANLQRFCDPRSVDAIVLSHMHGDHWTDIDGFLTAGRWTAKPPWGPVRVLAAPGHRRGAHPGARRRARVRGDHGLDEGDRGTLALSFSRTDHGPVTFAVRIEGAGTGARLLCRLRGRLVVRRARSWHRSRSLRGDVHRGIRGDGRAHERAPGGRSQHARRMWVVS